RRRDRRGARRARPRDRPAPPDAAVSARGDVVIRRRVVVANRRDGGWWWRMPVVAVLWLALALPISATGAGALTLRRWSRDLPEVPDRAAWQARAPQTSLVLAADGSHLAELPFRDGKVIGHRTLAPLERLPLHLVRAVLAAEDVRFFAHHGVD